MPVLSLSLLCRRMRSSLSVSHSVLSSLSVCLRLCIPVPLSLLCRLMRSSLCLIACCLLSLCLSACPSSLSVSECAMLSRPSPLSLSLSLSLPGRRTSQERRTKKREANTRRTCVSACQFAPSAFNGPHRLASVPPSAHHQRHRLRPSPASTPTSHMEKLLPSSIFFFSKHTHTHTHIRRLSRSGHGQCSRTV